MDEIISRANANGTDQLCIIEREKAIINKSKSSLINISDIFVPIIGTCYAILRRADPTLFEKQINLSLVPHLN